MTAQQPKAHPIPCESCNRPHTDHLCEYCHVRLTERDKDFIAIVGCASHTSAEPVLPDSKGEALSRIREPHGLDCEGCEPEWCAEMCFEWQKEHDAAVAERAREEVLKGLLINFLIADKEGEGRPWNIGHIESQILEYEKSLREKGEP